jgi:hypothetical protein
MDFSITTPTVLFPALSLLMLAHTNRFLALANVIRSLKREFDAGHDEGKALQIRTLNRRLNWIRQMQAFGVASLLACVVSMLLVVAGADLAAKTLFVGSLVLMSISLIISLREVFESLAALRVELKGFADAE